MDSRHARIHSRLQRHVQSPAPVPDHGFPILAVAVLGIIATALLLVAYYIFITKCCFNWQHFDPLRRFSSPNPTRIDDPLTAYSPSWRSRGLDEVLIREIPTFRYAGGEESGAKMASECVVCLSEFREADMLRVLPRCGHGFHLDCIDIWLQSNTNCPLCRAKISGEIRVPIDRIVAPASSPQYSDPTHLGRDEASPAIEFAGDDRRTERIQSSEQKKISKHRKRNHHLSIDVREKVEEEEEEEEDGFSITAIRRSFSMDSAADRNVYLSVQEILRQSRHVGEIRNGGESSSRVRRSFFSFGHGRGSKSSVLPIEL